MGKVGKLKSVGLLKEDQKIMKLVNAAYFHVLQYVFHLCFNCIFNIKTYQMYFKSDNYRDYNI